MILLMNAFILTSCEKEEDPTLYGYYQAEVISSKWDETIKNVIMDCITEAGFTRAADNFYIYYSLDRQITTYNWDSIMQVLRNKIEKNLIRKYPHDKTKINIKVQISFNRRTKEGWAKENPYRDKIYVARNK